MYELEQLTLKELRTKLTEMGMPEADANVFTTKAQMVASIKTLMAREAVAEEPKEPAVVTKVATLEEMSNPTEDREVNKRWKTKAEQMKAHLESQPKVSILIPLESGEQAGVVENRIDSQGNSYQVHVSGGVESVQLNGYKYFIPKGRYTSVPQQIAEVISHSQQQTLEAGSHISLDRIDPKTGRPFSEMM